MSHNIELLTLYNVLNPMMDDPTEGTVPQTIGELKQLKGISIGSLNIRSVFKHLDEVEILLKESQLDLLLLQETFLNYAVADPVLSQDKYYIFRQDRDNGSGKRGGGGPYGLHQYQI